MNPRTKNLALAGGAVAVVGFVAVNTLVAPAPPVAEPAGAVPSAAAPVDDVPTSLESPVPAGSPSGLPAASAAGSEAIEDRRGYAVGLQELAGFPPDAEPGARLELWVTWEPPVTKEPRLQKLVADVVLERTIPGSVPEAPVTVLLSVPTGRVGDLMYADAFGRLSVTLSG